MSQTHSWTDEQIMQKIGQGDVSLVSELFERHHRRLFRFCWRMTGDAQASEDLVQDVFVRIIRHRDTFSGNSSFSTWMFTIARNAQNDAWRKGRREVPLESGLHLAAAAPPEGREQEMALLRKAMMRLPEDLREVLVMHRFLGMSHEDIAAALGCAPGTSRGRMHRAITRLREIYLRSVRGRIS